jgi:hypothetical protein
MYHPDKYPNDTQEKKEYKRKKFVEIMSHYEIIKKYRESKN